LKVTVSPTAMSARLIRILVAVVVLQGDDERVIDVHLGAWSHIREGGKAETASG
jgi:hypothetical protein